MKILVTGGAGFIGSHTVVELLNAGHDVVIVDNLCNSSKKSLLRVKKITGKKPKFYQVDIRNEKKLNAVLDAEGHFDATIHFAALKAVGESTKIPLKYYANNLLPYVAQVAVGRRPELNVFGNDYPTPDGTGIRDYIHVVDLAIGHLKAIEKLEKNPKLGLKIYNLGTGNGYSVLQIVKAFEKASGRKVPYKICPRRPGDIAECWADPSLAAQELGWKAERGIDEMCEDAWRWQEKNPYGFNKPK